MTISPHSWGAERSRHYQEITASMTPDPMLEMRADHDRLAGQIGFGKSASDYLAATIHLDENERLFFAIMTYFDAVEAQGHAAFFKSEAGVVWKDAIRGLRLVGAGEHASILMGASLRAGGDPSLDWEQRQKQMQNLMPRFDDLDRQFCASSPLGAVWRQFYAARFGQVAA